MKNDIFHAFRRTPKIGRRWRYVPLSQLPEGTEVRIFTSEQRTPGELEPREVNGEDEIHVLRLPEGSYTLKVGEWGTVTLIDENGDTESLRPLHRVLAPGSCFQANVDRMIGDENITFRLVTGEINHINLPQAGINLLKEDSDKTERKYENFGGNRHKQYRRLVERG